MRTGWARKRAIVAASMVSLGAMAATAGAVSAAPPAPKEPGAGVEAAPELPRDGAAYVPSASEEFSAEEVTATAEFFSISDEAAQDRLASENEAMRLQAWAERRWPNEFAGAWLDTAGSPDIHLAFTGDTSARMAEVMSESELDRHVVGHAARHSLTALRAIQQRMGVERQQVRSGSAPTDMPASARQSMGRYAIDIDVRTNRLQVFSFDGSDPGSLQRDFRARYLPELDVVRSFEPTGAAACASRDNCRPTMRGGLGIFGAATCSTAFATHAASDSSRTFVLSAAHCAGGSGAERRNGGSVYGTVTGEVFGDPPRTNSLRGRVDAERIINDDGGDTWQNSSWVYLDPGNYREVINYVSWSNIVVGVQVVKSGWRSGQTRGLVDSRDYDTAGFVPFGNRFIRSGPHADQTRVLCMMPGDSGGSVLRNNTAYGIMTGLAADAQGNPMPCGTTGYFSFFGAFEYAISVLSLRLSVYTNCDC